MAASDALPTKTCRSCGRTMTWRKAWARTWDEVLYCSDGCRRRRVGTVDRALEEAIRSLLARRSAGSTICPSEAARVVADGLRPGDGAADGPDAPWRVLMEPARAAARRLVAAGEVEITQKGAVVDPSRAAGPIRIRAVRRP
jgi:hypothetical protein